MPIGMSKRKVQGSAHLYRTQQIYVNVHKRFKLWCVKHGLTMVQAASDALEDKMKGDKR